MCKSNDYPDYFTVEYGKQGGKIDQEGGGIFSVEEKWITVSVPDESEKHDNTQIDETKDEDDELADKIGNQYTSENHTFKNKMTVKYLG